MLRLVIDHSAGFYRQKSPQVLGRKQTNPIVRNSKTFLCKNILVINFSGTMGVSSRDLTIGHLEPAMAVLPAWHERAVCSYADAFREFVLEDPEVVAFASEGIKSAPEYETVFCKGRCTPYGTAEWPVDTERWTTIGFVHPDLKKRSVFSRGEPAPVEIALAAEALLRKYDALIGTLRQGEHEAYGVAELTGMVERIPRSIWQHEDFHISAQGDVFQENHRPENPPFDFRVRRWSAIELRRSGGSRAATTSSAFHVQPTTFEGGPSSTSNCEISVPPHRKLRRRKTPKADLVAAALEAEGLTERPVGLTYKEIAARIQPRTSGVKITDQALAKAIDRYFNKKPSAR